MKQLKPIFSNDRYTLSHVVFEPQAWELKRLKDQKVFSGKGVDSLFYTLEDEKVGVNKIEHMLQRFILSFLSPMRDAEMQLEREVLTVDLRRQVTDDLLDVKKAGMFGDGMNEEYILEGWPIDIGLNKLTDRELVQEWIGMMVGNDREAMAKWKEHNSLAKEVFALLDWDSFLDTFSS